MKTKSYKVYSGDLERQSWIEASETPDKLKIVLRINGGAVIHLDHEAWKDLMRLDYNLKCNMPDEELSQIPPLAGKDNVASEADTPTSDEHIELPMADAAINRIMKGVDDDE